MKTEIVKRESDTAKGLVFWSCIETCDDCGKVIFDHNWETTQEPNTEVEDLCIDCLRKKYSKITKEENIND